LKLGLGTIQFGMDYGINNTRGKVLKEEAFEILKVAWNNGIDMLDTSALYGESEYVIGQFLKENNVPFKIISKLPPCDADDIETRLCESLKKLDRDRLFGYLVHHFDFFRENRHIWDFLQKAKLQKKFDKLGFSLYYPQEVEYLIKENVEFDMVQVPFSVFDQRFSGALKVLREGNVEIHVRSVFLQGLVFKNALTMHGIFENFKDKLSSLHSISQDIGIPISALCLNFAVLNEYIDKVIIGTDSLSNLQENINALKYQDRVGDVYNSLLDLKEDNEKIILPFNWGK
jgi:aryl-alcohol dehydrogenase-like predicted oxidoreductase